MPQLPDTLRELREALRTFSHPGSDGNDGLFNFWEATSGRATIKMDDLQGSGVPVVTNQRPVAAGVLAPLTLAVGDAPVAVDVSGAFRDPDGDTLSYGASSSALGIASVVVFGSAVVVTPVSEGTATVTVTATDTGGSNTTATQVFTVTVSPAVNRPPVPVGRLGPVTLGGDDAAVTVEVSGAFHDPDGDTLSYGASSSAPDIATVVVSRSTVTVTAVSGGTATVTVRATDPGGSNTAATQTFAVTVSNRGPAAVGTLAPLKIEVDDAPAAVEVSGAFRDPEGDVLSYAATSSAPGVATVTVSGSTVTVTPVAPGTATVRVTATDAGGSNEAATQTFLVTVPRPFTDPVLAPGETPVRAVHFTELRTRIDALRSAAGLGRFAWTDPVLRPAVTPVRLAHLLDLREALGEAYAAEGRAAPDWTDAAPAGGATPIRAAHLMELRAA